MAEAKTKHSRVNKTQDRNELPPDANKVEPEVSMSSLSKSPTKDGRAPGASGGGSSSKD